MSTFSAQHHNALAKEIREIFPIDPTDVSMPLDEYVGMRVSNDYERGILATLALNLCKRFQEDNPRFDPIKFLDACSPNTDLYPLSELWEGDQLA